MFLFFRRQERPAHSETLNVKPLCVLLCRHIAFSLFRQAGAGAHVSPLPVGSAHHQPDLAGPKERADIDFTADIIIFRAELAASWDRRRSDFINGYEVTAHE